MDRGFSGFRSAGDLCWATESNHDCAQLVGYEALVQESYPGRPAVGMCQYSLRAFPADVLQKMLAHHCFCLTEPRRTTLYASLSLRTYGPATQKPKSWLTGSSPIPSTIMLRIPDRAGLYSGGGLSPTSSALSSKAMPCCAAQPDEG